MTVLGVGGQVCERVAARQVDAIGRADAGGAWGGHFWKRVAEIANAGLSWM